MMLRKSVKSLQIVLNESLPMLGKQIVSGAAFTKARQKLKHTAFIELNQQAVVVTTYANEHKRHMGLRILAVDGSKVILPNTTEIQEVFGTTAIKNSHMEGSYVSLNVNQPVAFS
jgi:hypothetical protein